MLNKLRPSPQHENDIRRLQDLANAVGEADRKALELDWELTSALDVRDAHRAAFRLRTEAKTQQEREDLLRVHERTLLLQPDALELSTDDRHWSEVLQLVSEFSEQAQAATLGARSLRLQYDTQRRIMRHREVFHAH